MSTEFDFTSRKLRFALHVGSDVEKREYKLECEFEEISSVRLVAIRGLPTRALSIQVNPNSSGVSRDPSFSFSSRW